MANLSQSDRTKELNADDNAIIVDVRTKAEFFKGHIPDAILINIYGGFGFISKVKELDKSKSYYVYCRSGIRSAQACRIMNSLGFKSTFNLVGVF